MASAAWPSSYEATGLDGHATLAMTITTHEINDLGIVVLEKAVDGLFNFST